MVNILALDPGSKCGWACSCEDGYRKFYKGKAYSDSHNGTRSGVYHVPKHDLIGLRFHDFRTWLCSMLRDHEVVAYEKAFVMPRGASTALFFGLIGILQEETAVRKIELVPVNPMRLKKWFAGYGRATKQDMLNEAWERFGPLAHTKGDAFTCPHLQCNDPVHDQVDAIAILHYAMELRA